MTAAEVQTRATERALRDWLRQAKRRDRRRELLLLMWPGLAITAFGAVGFVVFGFIVP